jgi:multidrug efflux pump subunit AcrA (membrane-fusion protein)
VRLTVVALAGVVAVGLTAASCGDDSTAVALGVASRGSVIEVVDAPAAVTARAAATLTAAADGTLVSLRVSAGDQVKAGQILGVIDSPSAEARLRQAEEALAVANQAGGGTRGVNLSGVRRQTDKAAQAAFDAARNAAGKIADPALRRALLAQVAVAEKRYDAASKLAGQAIRQVQRGIASLSSAMSALAAAQQLQAQQAYDLAKSTVDSLTLRAPIPGVVQLGGPAGSGSSSSLTDLLNAAGAAGAVPGGLPAGTGDLPAGSGTGAPPGVDGAVPPGGLVTAGTPVLTIVDLRNLGVIAEVDETDVLLVTPGQAATVELDAATGADYDATVRTVDVLPTPSTRGGVSYRVRLSLGGGHYSDGRVAPAPRPGMSAVVHLRVRQAADAVTVPAAAVFSSEGRDAVWVIRDGKAERTDVTVGVQGQDVVQIVSGVGDGQQVVVRGTDQVRAGQELP